MKAFITRIIEPKKQIPLSRQVFSNHSLKVMIVPLMIEQLLQMVVGMVDTMMVSYAGEATVSGVSLDNAIYTVFIYLFVALASGGTVVVSHYIGAGEKENASRSASQVFLIAGVFSVGCMLLMMLFGEQLLLFLYRETEPEVLTACRVYLSIVCLSFPANAIYNAGAALYRSMGLTGTTMKISLMMNLLNVMGNAVGIFILRAGAAGAAWPTVLSWFLAAAVMTRLCFDRKNVAYIRPKWIFRPCLKKIKIILRIAIPNGIESGLFQAAKVALSAMVATFGTAQIAAYGIGQSLFTLSASMLVANGPVFMTVVGNCMGANDSEAADYYIEKLLRLTRLIGGIWNGALIVVLPFIMLFYDISDETKRLVLIICLIHNVFSAAIQPYFNPLPAGLRAAGDVRYTMVTAIVSSVLGRMFFSWLLGVVFGWGVIGVTLAMVIDWGGKGLLTWIRYRQGKWKTIKVV